MKSSPTQSGVTADWLLPVCCYPLLLKFLGMKPIFVGIGELLLAGSNKLIRCDSSLFDSTSESAESKLFVSGNHTSLILPAPDNMAALLASLVKSEFLENFDCLIA